MPRCENFGPWAAVEGKMDANSDFKGHVIYNKLEDGSTVINSYPTFEEAAAKAKELYANYLSDVLKRTVSI